MNEEKKNKIDERRRKKETKKRSMRFWIRPLWRKSGRTILWGITGCDAQVALKRTVQPTRLATGSRWFQPRTAGFPLTRSAARARRLFRVELAGLSLNRDLQPAPRWTAAWTIRDLFTAETVSSNRSSRLLKIKPRLGLFHATWIR